MSSKTIYNENLLSVPQQTKNIDSARKHQTKKQVLGEIKNCILNQGVVTPLKQEIKNKNKYVLCENGSKTQSTKTDVKLANIDKTGRAKSDFTDIGINFLDCFDFRGKCCLNDQKNDEQIWSEMNFYDDSFINKILDVDMLDQVEESFCPDMRYEDDAEIFNYIKDESNYHYWPDVDDIEEESDIHSLLEKPHFINFEF